MRVATSRVTPQQIATMFPPVQRGYTTHDVRTLRDVRLSGLGAAAEPAPVNAALISKYLGWAALGIGGIVVLSTGFMVYWSFQK